MTRHPLHPAALLLFGSIAPIGAALFVQYVMHYPPCPLCMMQRYPYALVGIAAIMALSPRYRNTRWPLWLGIAGWLTTAAIAAYHVGIEQGWIVEEGGCSAPALTGGVDAIREKILNAPLVACNIVSLKLLGLSMAHWNFACGVSLAFMGVRLVRRPR